MADALLDAVPGRARQRPRAQAGGRARRAGRATRRLACGGSDAERVRGLHAVLRQEHVRVDELARAAALERDPLELRAGVGRDAEQVALGQPCRARRRSTSACPRARGRRSRSAAR